jgi:hypothetical protein
MDSKKHKKSTLKPDRRVSWKKNITEKNQNSICFGCFSVCQETKNDIFHILLVCFSVLNMYRKNRNKQSCFEKNCKLNTHSYSVGWTLVGRHVRYITKLL